MRFVALAHIVDAQSFTAKEGLNVQEISHGGFRRPKCLGMFIYPYVNKWVNEVVMVVFQAPFGILIAQLFTAVKICPQTEKKILRKVLLPILFVLTLALACGTKADTLVDGDMTFTGTVTATTVTVTVQCTDATCAGWFLGDVTLKGFTFTGTPTDGSPLPAGYTVMNGGQNNSGPGSGGGCNSTQPGKAVCFDVALPNTTPLGNGTWTFTADISGGSVNDVLHIQATAYNNSNELDTQKTFAVSQDLVGAPEPSSFLMLGGGLLGLALLAGRKVLTA